MLPKPKQTQFYRVVLVSFAFVLGLLLTTQAQTVIYSTNFGTTAISGVNNASTTLLTGWVASGAQAANMQVNTSSVSSTYSTPIAFSAGANLADGNATPAVGTGVVTVSGVVNTTNYNSIQVLWGGRKTAAYTGTITFQWSTDGLTWNTQAFTDVAANSTWAVVNGGSWISLPAGAAGVSDLKFKFTFVRTNTSGNYRIDDFTVRGVPTAPTTSVTGTLGGFITTQGTPSASQSFTVSGANLTSSMMLAVAQGFELSIDGGTTWSFLQTITPVAGAINQSVLIRLDGVSVGQYSEYISISSTGANSSSINAQGITYTTPTNFGTGNLVVVQAGSGALLANGTGVPMLIREFSTTGSYVQTISVPSSNSGSNLGMVMSNSGTSEGALNLSGDGQRLTFTGYNAASGTSNVASSTVASTPRVIGVLYYDGTVNTASKVTDAFDANNIRSAVTNDGTDLWVGGGNTSGASGIRYEAFASAGTTAGVGTATDNSIRVVSIFGGQLYATMSGALKAVGTGLPVSGGTSTNVMTTSPSDPYAFYFLDADATVTGNDLMYVANNTSLNKYSFDGTTWTARGTLTGTNITGVVAKMVAGVPQVYISNGTGLYSLNDNTAFNANIVSSGSALTAVATLIATPITNTAFRGVAFAPTAAPTCPFYVDADADGYGSASAAAVQYACGSTHAGYVTNHTDCNDSNSAVNPAATELPCNAIDDNCNNVVDETFVTGCNDPLACNYSAAATCATGCDYTLHTYYADVDGDGYGTNATSQSACQAPTGYTLVGGDCNDANNAINPGATEILCDAVDNNCNGTVDEGRVNGCTNMNASNYNAAANCDDASCVVTNFTSGNIVVLRSGDGSATLSGSATPMFLDEYANSGLVATVTLPTTGANRQVMSGSATSEGQMTRTEDFSKLVIPGYDAAVGTASINSAAGVVRVIGTVGLSHGSFTRVASSTGSTFFAGNNFRSAAGSGTNYWGGGTASTASNGGVNYFGTGTASPVSISPITNVRGLNICNGQLYFSTASGTRGIYKVGTGLPTTSGVVATNVIPTGASGDSYGFQFSPDGNTCYIADNTAGIQKWVFSNSVWSLAYTVVPATGFGARSVIADFYYGATPRVYAVATSATNTDIIYFDDNGTSTPTIVTVASNVNATTKTAFRSVAFAPCTPSTWYADADGDGYGNPSVTLSYCSQPYGYVATSTDCNDGVASIYPGASEVCNSLDDNCNSSIDEGLTFTNYYADLDGDGFGAGTATNACASPGSNYVLNNTDCNDADALINPNTVWYFDGDGDGYYVSTVTQCANPGNGYTLAAGILGDCNDANASINASASEVCNGIDDNCNSSVDEGLIFVNYYTDADGDGYGAGTASNLCANPGVGYVTNNTDCNDASSAVNPGATEICNGADDNCNSIVDDGLVFTNYYIDTDGDGYGAGSPLSACASPGAAYVTNNTDCNNNSSAINPGATELCSNIIDDNCNGLINEGCPGIVPGDNPSSAISTNVSTWPNCSTINGTLAGATASSSAQTICLTGEDKWYQFVATSEGANIVVNSTSNDIVLELQTAAGVLVAQENSVNGVGGEIMTVGGLTAGQMYKLGIRNYNSVQGIGTYSACVQMLKRGGCDYGAGPYSLCQYFKATWAGAAGTQYRYTFSGLTGPAAGNTYVRTQSTDICVLSNVTPTLPYGSTYSLVVTNIYTINNGAGVPVTVEVPALAPCSVNTVVEPVTGLRGTDQCSAGPRFRGSIVAALPWVCGATNWRWKFTEVNATTYATVGIPFEVSRGAASNFIGLGSVSQLQLGKTYAVQSAPVFAYTGSNYAWGPVSYMCIVGAAGMVVEGSEISPNASTRLADVISSQEMMVYPNPSNGKIIHLNLSGYASQPVDLKVFDMMGHQVYSSRVVVNEFLSMELNFTNELANGMYILEAVQGHEKKSQRFIVNK